MGKELLISEADSKNVIAEFYVKLKNECAKEGITDDELKEIDGALQTLSEAMVNQLRTQYKTK